MAGLREQLEATPMADRSVTIDKGMLGATMNGRRFTDLFLKLGDNARIGRDDGTYYYDNRGTSIGYNPTTKDYSVKSGDYSVAYNPYDGTSVGVSKEAMNGLLDLLVNLKNKSVDMKYTTRF